MWADLDYLQDQKMFTLSDQYQDLGDKIKTFKEKGVKFVPILNPGIAVVPQEKLNSYQAFKEGLMNDVFLKTRDQKQ